MSADKNETAPPPMMIDHPDQLVFIDFETFGLDFMNDEPIELGLVITNRDLEILDENSWLIWDTWYTEKRDEWIPQMILAGTKEYQWVLDQHTKSGLFAEAEREGRGIAEVHRAALDWLEEVGFPTTASMPMCGSSVNFDRMVAYFNLRDLYTRFHYRVLDVSTFKVAAEIWHPEMQDLLDSKVKRRDQHRVLPDLHDTIDALSVYVDNLLVTSR